jgi:hypothetical protein
MPTLAPKRFLAWSYSRLYDHEDCALKARFKHLDKLKEPGGPALERGARIDKLAENYSVGRISTLPEELKLFKQEFALLRKLKRLLNPQQNLALTKLWKQTDWFGADVWVRIKMDVWYDDLKKGVRRVIDYKTGKIRDENQDQLDLYAVGASAVASPAIELIKTELWYLDQGEVREREFTRPQADALRTPWEKRVAPMLADTKFKPNPGNACRWCFFGQTAKREKGGPGLCRF